MKANAPKRKIFNDAVDMITGVDTPVIVKDIQMLPVDSVKPFHDHPFRLYEGERLKDMVESVREHGILNPVIVLQTTDGYEMLSGHNRQNAAKAAGLKEIPAIVKKGLSEEEAYIYVIEMILKLHGTLRRVFARKPQDIGKERRAYEKSGYVSEVIQGRRIYQG